LVIAREITLRSPAVDAPRARIEWTGDAGHLAAVEPDLREVESHAAELAAGYNHPNNAELMGHAEPLSEEEVVESYAEAIADGARSFLLYRDGAFVGDGDLRHVHDGAAEFAFMIAATNVQGKGLGTKFALMIHAFGFGQLGLHHIYASVVPHNTASRRVFEKLGYVLDDSPTARGFADEPGDLVLAIDRETFERQHAAALAQIHIAMR
jgi:RimJ/RimL family protein N-acetyltransferase